jgi:hypothetical protein
VHVPWARAAKGTAQQWHTTTTTTTTDNTHTHTHPHTRVPSPPARRSHVCVGRCRQGRACGVVLRDQVCRPHLEWHEQVRRAAGCCCCRLRVWRERARARGSTMCVCVRVCVCVCGAAHAPWRCCHWLHCRGRGATPQRSNTHAPCALSPPLLPKTHTHTHCHTHSVVNASQNLVRSFVGLAAPLAGVAAPGGAAGPGGRRLAAAAAAAAAAGPAAYWDTGVRVCVCVGWVCAGAAGCAGVA